MLTAQILVGQSHPHQDGICPTHNLYLSENHRAAWTLVNQNLFPQEENQFSTVTWIPTIENMLEDALLMIAIYIVKDPEVVAMAQSFSDQIHAERMELYDSFTTEQLDQLYQKCRALSEFPKVVITAFRGSTIESHLIVVKDYKMDVEACKPCYSRFYSRWTQKEVIEDQFATSL